MNVLTAALFVLARVLLSSCRTQHSASHDTTEPEVALVSPRKVPTLAQLIPILEGPDLPEVKLRKLRKLIPIYDDLTKWRINHSERLVELLPYKKKAKPLAFILAGKDYMKLKKPDHKENDAKHDNKEYTSHKNVSDQSSVNSKFDVNIHRGYKSHNERPHEKSTKYQTKLEHSRNSYRNKKHGSEFSYNNDSRKKHKNNDNKSEFNSNQSESESNESLNESTESSSVGTESSEDKSIYDENTSKDDEKSDRKDHGSQRSHSKRPHGESYRETEYSKHSYRGKGDKEHKRRGHSSGLHRSYEIYGRNKNIDNSKSGSYSNEPGSKSNEISSEDTELWSEDESKSIENKSIDHNESVEKTSHHFYANSNKSKHLKTLNKLSLDDSASQESRAATEGLSSGRPYFIPHSSKSSENSHSTSLSDSNETDSISSNSDDNSLTANGESKPKTSSEVRTKNIVTESSENKSIYDENTSEDDGKSDRKGHGSQRSHTKRPHGESYRELEYSKHSYRGKHSRRGHSSELQHSYEIYGRNKNIDNSKSGSYSNEPGSKSNEISSEDTELWSEDESKSNENKSVDKNESVEKTSHHFYANSNKSKHLKTVNIFSLDNSASQEGSRAANEGLSSGRPYFIPHSSKSSENSHSTSLSDSNETDSISSNSDDNSLTANSESRGSSSETRTVSKESQNSETISSSHAVSIESNVSEDTSPVEYKDSDIVSRNHHSSISNSVSDESIYTELNASRSEAIIRIGSEVDLKTAESEETKELVELESSSVPVQSPSDEETDINSSDLEASTELNISDLESNQSESSVFSESDSNYVSEARSDAELALSESDMKSDASEFDVSESDENSSKSTSVSNESTFDLSRPESTSESVADENSSKSASVSNESFDSSGLKSTSESTSESVTDVFTSVSDENSKYESKSEESVSDVSKVSESDSNSSGLDSISDMKSEPDGDDVQSNEYDYESTETSNEYKESESTPEVNSNESVSISYDDNESTILESNKYSNEDNELTSTNSNEYQSEYIADSESGLESIPISELNDFSNPYETESESQSGEVIEIGKARISDEYDDIGDLDIFTEKTYEKDDKMMMGNSFGVFRSSNIGEESTKHNKDGHQNTHERHGDYNIDIESADTSHAVTEHNDNYKQNSARVAEKENLIGVTRPEETSRVGNDEGTNTPSVLLVDKDHRADDTQAPIHKTSMKDYNIYDVDVSDVVKHYKIEYDNDESVTPVVLEDNERKTANSSKHEKLIPINIVIRKDDKDEITKNILIKYDASRDNDIIIDTRTDKQDNDFNNPEYDANNVQKHHHIDVNSNTKQHKTEKLDWNENDKCDTSNNNLSVTPKAKHHHKTYKLSFIFN